MSLWVYFLGEKTGNDIKVGHSKEPTVRERLKGVNKEQTTLESYVMLAAVNASTKDEVFIKKYFAEFVRPDKNRGEYFWPVPQVSEYVNWLRSQWWASIDQDDLITDQEMPDSDHWTPAPGRSIPPPIMDPSKMVQDYEDPSDHLYNTAWSWMSSQKAGVQDYFTPPEIVNAAREAMGGIDLDAASHALANRTHKIPNWFHKGRSAFDNDWFGRVWLNPPYGHNLPWFERVVRYVDDGSVEQICILSPMWAFTTQIAAPVMERATGMILFTPTPKFWGNSDPDKTGRNDPHGVIYIGDRSREFHQAFLPFGIPVRPAWDEVNA